MQYAILIYQADGSLDHLTDEEHEELVSRHRRLRADSKSSGTLLGSVHLQEAYSATRVRRSGSQLMVEDGPFAESKETIIGLYLIDCQTLEDAVDHAKRIPIAAEGAVEIRPVVFIEDRSGTVEK